MPDYSDNNLRAAIKALDEVVAPAVDTSNPLAVEQLRLVSQFLRFFLERKDQLVDFELAELRRYVDLATELLECLPGQSEEIRAELHRATEQGKSSLRRPKTGEIGPATSRIAETISATVVAVAEADPTVRQRVERAVVERSQDLLDLKRAWFLPFGFEPTPERRQSLEALLAKSGP